MLDRRYRQHLYRIQRHPRGFSRYYRPNWRQHWLVFISWQMWQECMNSLHRLPVRGNPANHHICPLSRGRQQARMGFTVVRWGLRREQLKEEWVNQYLQQIWVSKEDRIWFRLAPHSYARCAVKSRMLRSRVSAWRPITVFSRRGKYIFL